MRLEGIGGNALLRCECKCNCVCVLQWNRLTLSTSHTLKGDDKNYLSYAPLWYNYTVRSAKYNKHTKQPQELGLCFVMLRA
jgi:hypothetical protein